MQASSPSFIDLVSSSSRDPSLHPPAKRSSLSDDCVEIHISTPSPRRISCPPPSPIFVSPTNRPDVGEGCSDLHNVYEQNQQYQDDFAWDNDGAFLHFDPHLRDQNLHQITYTNGEKTIYSDESDIRQCIHAKPILASKRRPKTRKSASSDPSDAPSVTKKRPKPKATQAKGKQRAETDPPLDEEWEAKLKESIIQDSALHLRILRYEVCYMLVQIGIFLIRSIAYSFRNIFTEGD